jgi:Acetyltransferase (GNAT) domain
MSLAANGLFFLSPHQVDAARWEACLAQSPQAIIYAHAWYLQAVCERWAAVVELRDGHYVSVLPLPEKRRAGLRQIYQPFFTQQLGLFTTARSRCTRPGDYLALIPRAYLRVHLQLQARHPVPAAAGYQVRQRTTYHLALDQPYEALYRGYSYNQQRNIRKGPADYQVVPGELDRLIALFRATKGPQVPALQNQDYARLTRLYRALQSQDSGQVLELWADGQLLAAALLLCRHGQLIYLFGASAPAGRQQAAMAKLLDWVIRQQAGSGLVLDFEGSDIPSLAKFYANFGARPVPYVSLSRISIPFLPTWLNQKFLS